MVYYNIYKIIKDIIRTIFGKKFLKILLLVIVCVVVLFAHNKVFGYSDNSIAFDFDNGGFSGTLYLPSWIKEHNLNYFVTFKYNQDNQTGFGLIVSDRNDLNTTGWYPNTSLMVCNDQQHFVSFHLWTSTADFNNRGFSSYLSDIQETLNNTTYEGDFLNKNGFHGFGNNNFVSISSALIVEPFSYKSTMSLSYQNEVVVPSSLGYPSFDNITEIENGNPDGVLISRGHYSKDINLYFHLLQISYTVPVNNSDTNYYYSDKVFALNKYSDFFRLWDSDPNDIYDYSYYYIPRYYLGLNPNTSYLYVLSSSGSQITNSLNILQENVSNGVYDVVVSDTTGVITSEGSINDKMQNIDETLSNNNVSQDTNLGIDSSLSYDKNIDGLENNSTGFFTRFFSLLNNLYNYDLSKDSIIKIPVGFVNKNITLHSIDIYNHITGMLRTIITAFWAYLFYFYCWKFLNNIFIQVESGEILDGDPTSGTVAGSVFIDML